MRNKMNVSSHRKQLSAFVIIVVISLLICCWNKSQNSHNSQNYDLVTQNKISSPQDLNNPDKIITGEVEVLATKSGKKFFTQAKFLEFATPPDCFLALTTGKADAFVYDRPALEYAESEHKDLMILPDNVAMGHISVAAALTSKKLIAKVNDFIRYYRANGIYKDMFNRWVYDRNTIMPNIEKPENPDGTIVVGVDTDNVPMSFIQNGEHVGFDIEFAERLALYLNKEIKFVTITTSALIQALQAGKIDLAIDQMDATPERRGSVLFSDEYIDSPVAVMIRKEDYASESSIVTFSDLEGKKIGYLTGSSFADLAKKYLPPAKMLSFSQVNQEILELNNGKIDAMLTDTPTAMYLLAEQPNLITLHQTIPAGDYALGFNKKNSKLAEAFSKEITKMRQDGSLKKLQDKWLTASDKNQAMPQANKSGKKLLIGVLAEAQPFIFIKDNKIVGYEAELALLIANKLGYKAKFMIMDPSAIISSLESGKSDIIGGAISITPERKENISFSSPIYDASVSVIVKKNTKAKTNHNFIQSIKIFIKNIKEGFNKTFIKENRWQLILQGLWVTLIITFFAVIVGTILAFPICMLSMSGNKFLSFLGQKYITIIQGTPILVILMVLYYVIFATVNINAVLVAILAFGLDFAAYGGVMLRAGIEGIPRGQTEASLALGFTPIQTFLNFVLPQAVRSILPVYRSEIISTLKATSIVGYIAIMDLTKASDIIRSRTYDAFFSLISTAIIYFVVAKCLVSLLVLIENKINPEYRRNKILKSEAK